ncbi:b2e84f87-c318-45be-b76d-08a5b75011a9-CDS [Sclerotinia trifoliorum]|uniref:B2e84f87-c318-45be-b76d-08a5b75011a9-CDS n=1 Tax=Sclerotinia trifoliorum TaxID=28548 RepID=A0A8H2VKH2_9HELO|nr:b2e84f87-c318-45be-b76d-08a5b75011a9-CDS [Sclerotinia trifoliorum]
MEGKLTVYKPFDGSTIEEFEAHVPKKEDFLLCKNCGWSADDALHSAYASHVRCKTNSNRGLWFIGDKYVLKEKPIHNYGMEDYWGAEYAMAKFLSENTTVPVPKVISYWKDSTSHFMLMERIPGETLQAALDKQHIDDSQLETILKEVVEYLVQIRKFTSMTLEDPDGSPIRDYLLGAEFQRVLFVTEDIDEWWARTASRIESGKSEEWKKDFKERYPVKGGPYVLTHGDLNPSNIMVKDGHVSGLIDWERGGYLPEWWEAVTTREAGYTGTALVREMEQQIGPFPVEMKKFKDEYSCYVKRFPRVEVVPCPEFDRWSYMVCPNFRRYYEEVAVGYERTLWGREIREQEAKEAAEEAAKQDAEEAEAFKAFKALSLEEREKLKNKD